MLQKACVPPVKWTVHHLKQSHRKIAPFSRLKSREKSSNSGGFSRKQDFQKKQKVTEVFYNAKDPTAEIHTHDAKQLYLPFT